MTIKEFINNFDFVKPDWSLTPEGFPNCDLKGLTSAEVGKFNSIKSLWELSRPPKPVQRSRVWQDPKGYEYLGVWQNAALLRVMVRILTKGMVKGEIKGGDGGGGKGEGKWEYRRKAQMDDAARSTVRNIEEGWKRATTSEYLDFLSYSQASLEEVNGDIRDCRTDGVLKSRPGSSLLDIGIDLRVAKGPGKGWSKGTLKGEDKGLVKGEGKGQYKGGVWGDPSEPGHPYYQPLSTLTPNTLTYEMFVELINKTDWLLRKLVESLERKLREEQKSYQIGQARIREKFKKKL